MEKILGNIVTTWWKTSNFSLRESCRNHVRTNNSWRYDVSTHNMKGINTTSKSVKKQFADVSTHNMKGINTR